MRKLIFASLIVIPAFAAATENPWYTEGTFRPLQRLEFTLTNNLAIDRQNTPITGKREGFSLNDFSDHIKQTALEYNNPVQSRFIRKQEKE